MPGKTDRIRAIFCISLFIFKVGSSLAFQPYDVQNPYTSLDSTQLDSVIRITAIKYQKHPANPLLIKKLAEAFTVKKEIDSAGIYWLKLAEIQPQNDTAWYRHAMLVYGTGKFESAYASLQQSLNIHPDRIDYLSLSAMIAYRLHNEDTSMVLCRRILSLDPQNINALLFSGIILRNQKNNEDALIQFDKCLKADPANTDALMHRAEIYVFLRKYNDALRDYSAARADLSTNPDVINNIGICYYQSGSYQKAITFFKKGIFINSLHPQSNFNKGLSYYKLNDFDTASVDIKAASAIWDTCYSDTCHANFLDALYYLGLCYKNIGDLPAAKSHFELLQKEGYARDLTPEIKHIEYALFISRNWYYIAAVFVLFIALIISVIRAARKR